MVNSRNMAMSASRRRSQYARETLHHVHQFGKRTTIHGISHLYQTKDRTKRVLWVFLTIGGVVMTFVHLYFHTKSFLDAPTTTVIDHQSEDFVFPDVTFCTLTPTTMSLYKRDKLALKDGWRVNDVIRLGTQYSFDEFIKLTPSEDIKAHKEMVYHQMASRSTVGQGFAVEEFVMSCKFKGENCMDQFKLVQDPYYWNCYTFHPNDSSVTSTNPEDGLILILYSSSLSVEEFKHNKNFTRRAEFNDIEINQETNNQEVEHSGDFFARFMVPEQEPSGFKVSIHERGSYPHARTKGVIFSSGNFVEIGLQMTGETAMNRAQSPCVEDGEPQIAYRTHVDKITDLPVYRNFSKEAFDCMVDLHQNYIYEKCGCYSHLLPIVKPLNNSQLCYNATAYLENLFQNAGRSQQKERKVLPHEKKNLKKLVIRLMNLGHNLTQTPVGKQILAEHDEKMRCHEDAYDQGKHRYDIKSCKQKLACQRNEYASISSGAPWPRDFDMAEVVTDYVVPALQDPITKKFKILAKDVLDIDPVNISKWKTYGEVIRSNFAKILMHPLQLKCNAHKEEEAYSIWEALGELGGITGLWVGMSFLAIFELVDLFIDIAKGAMARRRALQGLRAQGLSDYEAHQALHDPLSVVALTDENALENADTRSGADEAMMNTFDGGNVKEDTPFADADDDSTGDKDIEKPPNHTTNSNKPLQNTSI